MDWHVINTELLLCLLLRVVSRNPTWTEKPGERAADVKKKKKWTSYEKKDSLFRLHPLFSWQSAGQRSPSSNVPCPLHLPVASHLSLPPLLYSISIKASLTLDGEDAVCLYFVVDVVVVVFEVNCWLVLFFFLLEVRTFLNFIEWKSACVCFSVVVSWS